MEKVRWKGNSVLRMEQESGKSFISGAYHANEWITTPVLLKFAEEYAHAFAAGRMLYTVQAAWLFYGFSLYLVPLVNPDGVDLVNGVLEEGASLEEAERLQLIIRRFHFRMDGKPI